MREHLAMHPCMTAMITTAGMTAEEYLARTRRRLSWRTSDALGARSTPIEAMPGLPTHACGVNSRGEIVALIVLDAGVRLQTASATESASLLVPRRAFPSTVVAGMIGRPASDVVDHAMFAVDGLVVEAVEDDGAAPLTRLRIGGVEWTMTAIGDDDVRRCA